MIIKVKKSNNDEKFLMGARSVFFKKNLWDRSQIVWARENHLDSIVS